MLIGTAVRFCTAFFCVSKAVEYSWFGGREVWEPGKRLQVRRHWTLYNGVDVEAIAGKAAAEGPGLRKNLGLEGHPVVGVVGRLRHEKGQDVLLEAFALVLKDAPDARLLVVGDGPDRQALERQADSLGIAGQVVWVGSVPPEGVYGYYGAMDILVVPSRFEGFGLVAVEGMAAGVPVVASDVEGLSEVVEHEIESVLVPAADSQAMARALTRLLVHPGDAQRIAGKSRSKTYGAFSMERFREGILALSVKGGESHER
jgi:glycosyltransferase involved in cell wall biosynthesis